MEVSTALITNYKEDLGEIGLQKHSYNRFARQLPRELMSNDTTNRCGNSSLN